MSLPYNPDLFGHSDPQQYGYDPFTPYANLQDYGPLYYAAYPDLGDYQAWARQMLATRYQNWYNSEPEKMKRSLEAGINPFVAASGIAGSSTGSVAPAPDSNKPQFSDIMNGTANVLGSTGSAFGSIASGYSILKKLRPEIDKIDAETLSIFENLGFSNLQSKAMQIRLKYLDEKEQIGVWQALADFDKTKQEYNNLVATHQNILAQYDEIISNKELLIAEKGEVEARKILDEAMANKANEETKWSRLQNEFFENHGYRAGDPLYEGLRDKMVSDGTFDMESYGNTVANYQGKITDAIETAKASASWDYRPSNVAEAAAYFGSHLGESLRNVILNSNGVTSWSELKTKVFGNAKAKEEFIQGYKDAKEDLHETYLAKKRYYRNISRGGNTQEVARAKMDMDNAKVEYDTFTIDKFGNELLSQTFKDSVK